MVPNYGIFKPTNAIQRETLANVSETSPSDSRLRTYWEFQGEDDLRRTLSSIAAVIVSQGLDWFEEQIVHVKRYHEKLERRRQSTKRGEPSGNSDPGTVGTTDPRVRH